MAGDTGSQAGQTERGQGCAGLCCGALLAKYGFDVLVVESHDVAGGAAHTFERKGYAFDSGPSFFAGLSGEHSKGLAHACTIVKRLMSVLLSLTGRLTISWRYAGPPGRSPNPLKQVLDAVGESVECAVYDRVSSGASLQE